MNRPLPPSTHLVARAPRKTSMRRPSRAVPSKTLSRNSGDVEVVEVSWNKRLKLWFSIDGPKYLILFLWLAAQIGLFTYTFIFYFTSDDVKTFRKLLGITLPVARASAAVLRLNISLVLFSVCRKTISFLRPTFLNKIIPFDRNIDFHKLVGWTIVLFSALHVIAHALNFRNYDEHTKEMDLHLSAEYLSFGHPTGITGMLMTATLFLMATSAYYKIRRPHFEIFWYTHHLFIIFFGLYVVHGSFCLIKQDVEPYCVPSTAWMYWVPAGSLYVFERIYRELRSRRKTYISKVISHPNNVVELQIKVPGMVTKGGQYIFVSCPELALFQWHPFTLTSCPEEDYVAIHMRVVGDWTTAMAERLGVTLEGNKNETRRFERLKNLPRVLIDGPYGSASEDVFNYEVAFLVGAGIGVTPFASILKSIWYRVLHQNQMKLKRVYFVWSCREIAVCTFPP